MKLYNEIIIIVIVTIIIIIIIIFDQWRTSTLLRIQIWPDQSLRAFKIQFRVDLNYGTFSPTLRQLLTQGRI